MYSGFKFKTMSPEKQQQNGNKRIKKSLRNLTKLIHAAYAQNAPRTSPLVFSPPEAGRRPRERIAQYDEAGSDRSSLLRLSLSLGLPTQRGDVRDNHIPYFLYRRKIRRLVS